jgi:tRNA A-37 threonylcarbamoyl transferase component Bud32
MVSIPDIPYSEAHERRGACIHPARSVAQADLYEFDWEGRPALLKDFNGRPALVRRWWSAHVCAREARALRRLDELEGVPHLYATAGDYAFVMERLMGTRLPRKREPPPPPPEFWARARALLERLHAAGVSHGDLRRKNLLMGPAGEAYLIDFATAARLRDGGLDARFSRFLFRHMCRIDRVTFARIKASYDPQLLDADERRWLADQPWHLRLGRWLKRHVYRLSKPRARRKRLRFVGRWLLVKLGRHDKPKRYH